MSLSSVDILSRPERACVKHSEEVAVEKTGFQPVLHNSQKKFKKRRRATHEVLRNLSLSKPSPLPEDHIFTYFRKRAEEEDGASCVFLLYGSDNSESSKTWAVDVPITELENEHEIFNSLAKKYDKELGLLRRCLSFRKFSKLKPVTVYYHRLIAYLPVLKFQYSSGSSAVPQTDS